MGESSRVAEFPQGDRLELADPLPGEIQPTADLFEGVRVFAAKAESQEENLLLSLLETVELVGHRGAQLSGDRRVQR